MEHWDNMIEITKEQCLAPINRCIKELELTRDNSTNKNIFLEKQIKELYRQKAYFESTIEDLNILNKDE